MKKIFLALLLFASFAGFTQTGDEVVITVKNTAQLVPTSVKTSAYTVAPNEFVPVNATSANVTITLPNAPADKTQLGVKLISVASGHTATVTLQGSDVLNKTGGNTTFSLSLLNQGVILQYASASHIWYVRSTDIPLSGLDARFAAIGTGTGSGTIELPADVVYLSKAGVPDDAVLTLNSSTLGTDGTAAIQAILNKRLTDSALTIYWDTHTSVTGLVIYGNTTIIAAPGCGAILRTNAGKPLITNAHKRFSGTPIDKDIVIDGGIWNGNNANQASKANLTYGNCDVFAFYGVDRLTLKNLSIFNQKVYSIQGINIQNGLYENGIVNCGTGPYTGGGANNTDGIHFDGNSNNCIGRNWKIRSFDDAFGVNADDIYNCTSCGGTGFYTTDANGPANNILFQNIILDSGLYGGRFMTGSHRGNNITFDNITGVTTGYAVIGDNYRSGPSSLDFTGNGNFGKITLKDINVEVLNGGTSDGHIVISANIDELNIINQKRSTFNVNNFPSVLIDGSHTIKHLNIPGYQSQDNFSSMTTPHIWVKTGTVNRFTMPNATVSRSVTNASPLIKVGGTINILSLPNAVAENIANVVQIDSGGQVDNINAPGMVHIPTSTTSPSILNNGNTTHDVVMSSYSGYMPVGGTGTFTAKRGDAFTTATMGMLLDPSTSPYTVFDNFDRTNSTSSIGNTVVPDSAWHISGGTWGVISGEGYCVSETSSGATAINHIWAETGLSDLSYSVDIKNISSSTSDAQMLLRYTDSLNYIILDYGSGNISLYKREAGAYTQLGSTVTASMTAGSTHTMKIVAAGTSIQVYRDGVLMITQTSSFNQTATKIGFVVVSGTGFGGGIQFDNLKVVQ